MLNLGFSASDMGVNFASHRLRVYNTFIVLNGVSANLCVSPQGIEKFAKNLHVANLNLQNLLFRILLGCGVCQVFFSRGGCPFSFCANFAMIIFDMRKKIAGQYRCSPIKRSSLI